MGPGRRDDEADRALLAHAAEQLREAQVIADRHPETTQRRVGHDDLVTGAQQPLLLAVEAEQVHLAVSGELGAVGSEQHRRVVETPAVGFDQRTGVKARSDLGGRLRQRVEQRGCVFGGFGVLVEREVAGVPHLR